MKTPNRDPGSKDGSKTEGAKAQENVRGSNHDLTPQLTRYKGQLAEKLAAMVKKFEDPKNKKTLPTKHVDNGLGRMLATIEDEASETPGIEGDNIVGPVNGGPTHDTEIGPKVNGNVGMGQAHRDLEPKIAQLVQIALRKLPEASRKKLRKEALRLASSVPWIEKLGLHVDADSQAKPNRNGIVLIRFNKFDTEHEQAFELAAKRLEKLADNAGLPFSFDFRAHKRPVAKNKDPGAEVVQLSMTPYNKKVPAVLSLQEVDSSLRALRQVSYTTGGSHKLGEQGVKIVLGDLVQFALVGNNDKIKAISLPSRQLYNQTKAAGGIPLKKLGLEANEVTAKPIVESLNKALDDWLVRNPLDRGDSVASADHHGGDQINHETVYRTVNAMRIAYKDGRLVVE